MMWEENESNIQLLSDDEDPLEDRYGSSLVRERETRKLAERRKILLPCPLLPTASCVAALGGILFGYDVGIISGALLQLREYFELSCKQQEIVVTCLLIGGLFASILGGFIVDRYGRRVTIILNAFIFMIGAAILASAKSYLVLIFGRLVVGFAVSLSAIGECIYISEISPPTRRGFLVSLNELGITLGILIAYLVNYLFIKVEHGWRYMFGLSALPAFLQAVGMSFLPASPRWLLTKGREAESKALIPVLWPNLDSEKELGRLKHCISSEKDYKWSDLFRSDENLRMRMVIGCGMIIFQQLTGQPTVLYYAPSVFESLGFHSHTSSTLATLGLGATKFAFTMLTLIFVDKLGRRKFLLLGTCVMTISLIVLTTVTVSLHNLEERPACQHVAGYHRIVDNRHSNGNYTSLCLQLNSSTSHSTKNTSIAPDLNSSLHTPYTTIFTKSTPNTHRSQPNNCTAPTPGKKTVGPTSVVNAGIKYACLLSLMTFVIGYALGYGPMSWLLLTEIFPPGIKGRAVATATVFNWGTHIIISLTFLDVIGTFGPSYTFMMYAALGVLSIIFVFHFIPETKQRSLEQINRQLINKTIRCDNFPCRRKSEQRLYSLHADPPNVDDDDDEDLAVINERTVLRTDENTF